MLKCTDCHRVDFQTLHGYHNPLNHIFEIVHGKEVKP